jgi:predicted RNase H-like nuclease (RuvC/YqgF family)
MLALRNVNRIVPNICNIAKNVRFVHCTRNVETDYYNIHSEIYKHVKSLTIEVNNIKDQLKEMNKILEKLNEISYMSKSFNDNMRHRYDNDYVGGPL